MFFNFLFLYFSVYGIIHNKNFGNFSSSSSLEKTFSVKIGYAALNSKSGH